MVIDSGLFIGTLRHRRFAPIAHAFTYPLFMALLDIDRLPELMRVSRVTGYNRFNWASFHDRDHLGDPARPLRERLAVAATGHGLDLPDGRIFLLTHLRYFGYGFNPVSFFYCFDAAEQLQIVVAEVNNTFGGTHNYWLRPDSASRSFRAVATKSLYVSPFMPVDVDYAFAFTLPEDRLVAHMATIECRRGGLRRHAVARTTALGRERDPALAPPASGDDRARGGRHSLASAQVVVEGGAARAPGHARWRRRACGVGGRGRRSDGFGDGAMSMVTQWAKTAFLSGLGGPEGRNADRGVPRSHVQVWG